MGTKIDLPNTLTADVDIQYVDENRYRGDYRYFIVLNFGNVEISRWEWQADKLPEERSEPDEYDITDFVASKLRALLSDK